MARKKKQIYKSVKISTEVHTELVKVSEQTDIPILALVKIAVPLLKEKYGIKE